MNSIPTPLHPHMLRETKSHSPFGAEEYLFSPQNALSSAREPRVTHKSRSIHTPNPSCLHVGHLTYEWVCGEQHFKNVSGAGRTRHSQGPCLWVFLSCAIIQDKPLYGFLVFSNTLFGRSLPSCALQESSLTHSFEIHASSNFFQVPCVSGTLLRTKSLKQPCQVVQAVHKKSFHKCRKPHRMDYCTFWNLVLNMASLLWHFGRSLVMILWVVYGAVDPSDSFTGLSLGDSKSFGLLIFH